MPSRPPDPLARSAWDDALLAAACIAVDPLGLGGIHVRAAAGPVRDAWTARWRALVDATAPIRSVPLHVDDGRLLGGLDLAASLRAGRPVRQPGLLAEIDGGFALLSMAERIDPGTAARIAAVVESGETGRGTSTRFALIAFDEGDEDEVLADALAERLALCVDLRGCSVRTVARDDSSVDPPVRATRDAVDAARLRLPATVIDAPLLEALCAAAAALGIDSLRMPLCAVRAARAIAALDGRTEVDAADAARAARLVFSSRATRQPGPSAPDGQTAPAAQEMEPPEAVQPAEASPSPDREERSSEVQSPAADDPRRDAGGSADDDAGTSDGPGGALDDRVVAAAVAAMPAGLLARLAQAAATGRAGPSRSGGAGALGGSKRRGAPAGIRRGRPRPPERLSLVETLRAAAPWQRIRRAERSGDDRDATRVQVRAEDLHVVRFRQRRSTTTVFVVDASGSSALNRLAEAKGAVELLLADCYVRRDRVAVLAFRGADTQLLLPATRSLVRARRSLVSLPGGGGTPLASALDALREIVVSLRRRGDTALGVLLTDGRANVARDGSAGRPQAEADALVSARALRAIDVDVLMIDTSPRPYPQAAALAEAMGALYRPLPHAGARAMSKIVGEAARGRIRMTPDRRVG